MGTEGVCQRPYQKQTGAWGHQVTNGMVVGRLEEEEELRWGAEPREPHSQQGQDVPQATQARGKARVDDAARGRGACTMGLLGHVGAGLKACRPGTTP